VGTVVRATLSDFRIRASAASVPAGVVTLVVRDPGPSTHEFNLVRTDVPAGGFPLQSDGLSVNEDAPALHLVGSIESLDINDQATLRLRLAPGHYVMYCNLEGHYLGGMHASLDVR
jgi:uncharacterized cupredoxin-like copper-binding protein